VAVALYLALLARRRRRRASSSLSETWIVRKLMAMRFGSMLSRKPRPPEHRIGGGFSMSKRSILVVGGICALLWYLFRPEFLFVERSVTESPRGDERAAQPGGGEVQAAQRPSVLLDVRTAVRLASGLFHGVAHETKGSAAILELSSGKRILRLTDFETSNGPDVRVLLIAASDAADSDTVVNSAPIELGRLKGTIGDQNYPIPTGVDLARYRAVTIWCHRFGVNFGTAPLS
jgi:electron transfer DM13